MKKAMVICMMMVLVVCMSVTAFAAPNGFVSSPSKNLAPEVIESENENKDCTADLITTSFADREDLPEAVREQFEKTYDDIRNVTDLTQIVPELKDIADDLGVKGEDVAASDLFNVRYEGCDEHEDHGNFDIVLKVDTAKNFVGLLHNNNGKWELVKNATIKTKDSEYHLTFNAPVSDLSFFAIAVDASKEASVSPETGDNAMTACLISVVASALAIVLFAVKAKKQAA